MDAIHSLGGLAATHELYALGETRRSLRSAVALGMIWRVRKGWYAAAGTHPDLVRAARVGGRLSCVSAGAWFGWWVPERTALHVAVTPQSSQLRSSTDSFRRLGDESVHVHWVDEPGRSRLVVDQLEALRQIACCLPAEDAFAVWESAIVRSRVTASDLRSVRRVLPVRARLAVAGAGALSGSGTESAFAFRLRRLGIAFRQQVQIGRHRVDFLIGRSLVIEIDSRAHHDRASDTRRDAELSAAGFRVLRFPYELVMHEWPVVLAALIGAMERGDHR
jgi:very-short-patch-repair endonuclease